MVKGLELIIMMMDRDPKPMGFVSHHLLHASQVSGLKTPLYPLLVMSHYGVVKEIIEMDYYGFHKFTLLKGDWFY